MLDIPVTFCVVKSEPITPQGHYAYRKLIAVKCLWSELDRLYAEYQRMCYGNIGCTTMVFTREPDETSSPVDNGLKDIIEKQQVAIDGLRSALTQEIKWKDQLAEDNRILREKLDIPDSHFKYANVPEGVIAHDFLEAEGTKVKDEYNDW